MSTEETTSSDFFQNRLNKIIEALKGHGINQSQIAIKLKTNDVRITRLKQEQSITKQSIVNDFAAQIEEKYASLVKYDTISDDYLHLVPPKGEKAKSLIVGTMPNLEGFQFLTDELRNGIDNFDILDTWTHYLNQGGERYIIDWFKNTRKNIRILILHPLCDAFRLRIASIPNEQLKNAQGQLLDSLDNFIKHKQDRGVNCKIEVRLYEEPPAINAYILDDIVYFGHYFIGDLSQNFFFTRTEGKENYIVEQIQAHFNSIWDNSRTSVVTEERVKKLRELTELKSAKTYLLGDEYCLYNMDETNEGVQLQTSTVFIKDKSAGLCDLIISNRLSGEEEVYQGKIKIVSQGNLLMTFMQGHFFLEILLAPADYNQPHLIQGVYLHSDNRRFPRGAFTFLVDKKQLPELCKKPSRYKLGMDLNPIENYLAFERFALLSFKRKKSALHDFLSPSDDYRKILQQFAESGDWGMIYPERNPVDINLRRHDFLNALGSGRFWIEPNEKDGNYQVFFKTLFVKDFKGSAHVTSVAGVYYLNCSLLQSPELKVFLNIIIRIGYNFEKRRMKGVYNIVYQNGQVGCGVLIIGQDIDTELMHINPLAEKDKLPAGLPNMLQFKSESSLILHSNDQSKFYYDGVFEVYSYGRFREEHSETKCIILSHMRIHSNGYVEFKGLFPHGEAYGHATLILGNIYIELKNSSNEFTSDRKGYFIIAVKDTGGPKEEDIYGGVFAGLSHPERLPLCKRLVAQYIGNEQTHWDQFGKKQKGQRIRLYSDEYKSLEKPISTAITGRLNNYLGFQAFQKAISNLHELEAFNDMEIPLAKIFLESALYKASQLNTATSVPEVVEVLRQAFNHGLDELDTFEQCLKKYPLQKAILENKEYQNLKNLLKY